MFKGEFVKHDPLTSLPLSCATVLACILVIIIIIIIIVKYMYRVSCVYAYIYIDITADCTIFLLEHDLHIDIYINVL
jgi:hypothetical protein